jgi:hypothetical protein
MRFLLLTHHLHKNDGKEEGGEKKKGERRSSCVVQAVKFLCRVWQTTREKAFVVEWQPNERIRQVLWMRESVRISWFAKN